ncbi:MAG: hypothetical protein HDR41_04080 [Lactobacillus sp.]|nr:hypothetical protein [Lactobacillus sp.]
MVEYDDTHITGALSPSAIGEAVRHKKYGVDMREAIAQGFEQFADWYEEIERLREDVSNLANRMDTLEQNYSTLRKDVDILQSNFTTLQNKHNDDIKELTILVDKLNKAVFGLASAEINTPPVPDYSNKRLEEINFDDRKDKTDKW